MGTEESDPLAGNKGEKANNSSNKTEESDPLAGNKGEKADSSSNTTEESDPLAGNKGEMPTTAPINPGRETLSPMQTGRGGRQLLWRCWMGPSMSSSRRSR